ncbi:hypothetical protein [Scytonema sp. UIC 10036]|uniref:hypothetical protein n=1 Tax=Scytonema sp. UIC 10036 TaxID=2304196 RepID=UPI001FAB1797|nr:hypothetical protein [Scytonema sp. UIC 10036]
MFSELMKPEYVEPYDIRFFWCTNSRIIQIEGRETTEAALVAGDEVLIGQT